MSDSADALTSRLNNVTEPLISEHTEKQSMLTEKISADMSSSGATPITLSYTRQRTSSAASSTNQTDKKTRNDVDPKTAKPQQDKRSNTGKELELLLSEVKDKIFTLHTIQKPQYTKEECLKMALYYLVKPIVIEGSKGKPNTIIPIYNWNEKLAQRKTAGKIKKSKIDIDIQAATDWLIRASAQNDSMAQYMLGIIEHYTTRAIQRLTCAAENGNDLAQYALADCYYFGLKRKEKIDKQEIEILELKPDLIKACKYYRMSAESNNNKAQQALAFCYLFGEGVEKSIDKSLYWLITALGHQAAYEKLSDADKYENDTNRLPTYNVAVQRLIEIAPDIKLRVKDCCPCVVM